MLRTCRAYAARRFAIADLSEKAYLRQNLVSNEASTKLLTRYPNLFSY